MTTWEEIRDEVAGMLADGKPLKDVIEKLEQRKNEMAKANLIAVMDEMKKQKPMTNEEWLKQCNTEQLARWIVKIVDCDYCPVKQTKCKNNVPCIAQIEKWLKQPHTFK